MSVPMTVGPRMAKGTRRGGGKGEIRVHWVNQYAVMPDQPGGTRHYEMGSALRTLGYDVGIVASDLNLTSRTYTRRTDAADRRAINEDIGGVPFVWLPAGVYDRNDWRRAFSMVIFALHVFAHLVRTVRRGDVVIGSTPQLLAAGAARLASLFRGSRFILEVRDLWPESLTEVSARRHAIAIPLRIVADALYRTSAAIVILAEGNRDLVIRHGGPPKRIVFVPNGVDSTTFAEAVGELPPGLSFVADIPTFVYSGAHGPANGLELVLRAALNLQHQNRNDVKVLLIGDGPIKAQLVREADRLMLDNVVFHDPVPKHAIPGILRHCTGGLMVLKDVDLFKYGVSPNKLFDYLACDIPVVTNVPGEVARTVERAQAGIVVPPNDAEALATGMLAIADGQAFPSGTGSRYTREHHDRSVLADRMARVIDAVSR